MRLRVALAVALLVTSVHWVVASREARAMASLDPFQVGGSFSVRLQGISEPPEGCWTAFIVEPGCAGCRNLAAAVGQDVVAHERVNIVWIVAAGLDEATRFAAGHSLPPERTFFLEAAKRAPPVRVLRRLGIPGVPTRVVVSSSPRMVLDIELGGAVPEDSTYAALCTRPPG